MEENVLHIGVRAHDFGRLPAATLAARIAAEGLSCVQLAINKGVVGLNLQPGDMTPGLAYQLGRAFADHRVEIAVLGCYINLSNPDAGARRPMMQYFKDHLHHARGMGCAIVATETGSLNADWSAHPENASEAAYGALVPVVAELVEEAERFGVMVGIEGVAHHVLNSPARIRRLIDDLRSPNLRIVFDPVNLLTFENYREQDRIMQESFDLFGERIAAVHAKDFVAANGILRQVPAGGGGEAGGEGPVGGGLNYRLLLDFLQRRKPGIAILLEESGEGTAGRSMAYLRRIAGEQE
jgi:sugar phosphate isomerase/epimerase